MLNRTTIALAWLPCSVLGAPGPPCQSMVPEGSGTEVSFAGAGELDLHGTLLLPDAIPEGGAPALLLLPGSGPTDRNGNQPPALMTDLLRQVAERLALEGWATLRFDKRASSRYHPRLTLMSVEDQNEFFGYDAFVRDATAGLAFMRAQEGVDARRCGILGHSEGGLFALQIAHDTAGQTTAPDLLVLAGTSGVNMAELLRFQIGEALALAGEKIKADYLGHLDRAMEQVVESGSVPGDLPVGLQALFPPSAMSLLRVELSLAPTTLAAGFAGPVLIWHGEKDTQVTWEESTSALRSAFDERGEGTCDVVVIEGASHNFKEAVVDPFIGDVMPEALDGLAEWLVAAAETL